MIEGFNGRDKAEMTANLMQMASDIGTIVFGTDIVNIFRMRRRHNSNLTPGPVLVTFNRISFRDNIVTTVPLSVCYGGAKPLGLWVRTSNFIPCE